MATSPGKAISTSRRPPWWVLAIAGLLIVIAILNLWWTFGPGPVIRAPAAGVADAVKLPSLFEVYASGRNLEIQDQAVSADGAQASNVRIHIKEIEDLGSLPVAEGDDRQRQESYLIKGETPAGGFARIFVTGPEMSILWTELSPIAPGTIHFIDVRKCPDSQEQLCVQRQRTSAQDAVELQGRPSGIDLCSEDKPSLQNSAADLLGQIVGRQSSKPEVRVLVVQVGGSSSNQRTAVAKAVEDMGRAFRRAPYAVSIRHVVDSRLDEHISDIRRLIEPGAVAERQKLCAVPLETQACGYLNGLGALHVATATSDRSRVDLFVFAGQGLGGSKADIAGWASGIPARAVTSRRFAVIDQDRAMEVLMHEVGHLLGLQHEINSDTRLYTLARTQEQFVFDPKGIEGTRANVWRRTVNGVTQKIGGAMCDSCDQRRLIFSGEGVTCDDRRMGDRDLMADQMTISRDVVVRLSRKEDTEALWNDDSCPIARDTARICVRAGSLVSTFAKMRSDFCPTDGAGDCERRTKEAARKKAAEDEIKKFLREDKPQTVLISGFASRDKYGSGLNAGLARDRIEEIRRLVDDVLASEDRSLTSVQWCVAGDDIPPCNKDGEPLLDPQDQQSVYIRKVD